jgi:hypothetical protein
MICGFALLPIAAAAGAAPFAIDCSGHSRMRDTITGTLLDKTDVLPKQTYVIDEAARTVSWWMSTKQQYDPACGLGYANYHTDISPGLISVETEGVSESGTATKCKLQVNRKTGEAEWTLQMDFDGGRYHKLSWMMQCRKGIIPVVDQTKNKF